MKGAGSFRVGVRFRFSFAHCLYSSHVRLYRNIHGHNAKVEVIVEGNLQPSLGKVFDFGRLDGIARDIANVYDHCLILNEKDAEHRQALRKRGLKLYIFEGEPTAENLAIDIGRRFLKALVPFGVRPVLVRFYEDDDSWAEADYNAIIADSSDKE